MLKYFESAVQIGMTATPLSSESVQTDEYSGKSLYTYSLRTGINDGFLAPYRVSRVLMGEKPIGEQEGEDKAAGTTETAGRQEALQAIAMTDEEDLPPRNDPLLEESSAALLARTNAIAQHLATHM